MYKIKDIFVDIACSQECHFGEVICGDTFLSQITKSGDESIAVLADGLGHGVKANVLSTLTASMAINNEYGFSDIKSLAYNIVNTLPVCSKRKVSYSTFSIVKINHKTKKALIIEYDNPRALIYREDKIIEVSSYLCEVERENYRPQKIYKSEFDIQTGDRIVLMSDGVTHSGINVEKYKFGWGRDNVSNFVSDKILKDKNISSKSLSNAILIQAVNNEKSVTFDDISCAVITIRKPKKAIIVSSLPQNNDKNSFLSNRITSFEGKKMIWGYHTASIISNVSGNSIKKDFLSDDIDIPPMWHIKGIDVVSECMKTINKVYNVLNHSDSFYKQKGGAFNIVKTLLESDSIHFVIGKNNKEQNDSQVQDFILEKNMMKNIYNLLENQYQKAVTIEYV
ncbi:MAG: SpoIIE family protein phosphatase [Bacteroidetes bacterium]|nr:SpoIIE family protein phosphatase [Bacteroidota bacterium]